MMQIKWKKISEYCIECNNVYISRYKIASGANRYALWLNSKLIKIDDDVKVLKNEAVAIIESESSKSADLLGKLAKRRQTSSNYSERKS
jgi:protein associated with RNAse G/E